MLEKVRLAAERAGRDRPPEVLAVTKYASVDQIRELLGTGLLRKLGESRVQDAGAKIAALGRQAEWHMIGRLQTNKARHAAEYFDCVQSVDNLKLAGALDRVLAESGRTLPALIQIRGTDRATQGGLPASELPDFLAALSRFPRLHPAGLMAIAPQSERIEDLRPFFQSLRRLFETHFDASTGTLSMGMSQDFELAIEEGATMVRLGSVIFGDS